MTTCKTLVNSGAGVHGGQRPDTFLVTKGQAITGGGVLISEHVGLIWPIGDEGTRGAEIKPAHGDWW